jgi:hypothetical protein
MHMVCKPSCKALARLSSLPRPDDDDTPAEAETAPDTPA